MDEQILAHDSQPVTDDEEWHVITEADCRAASAKHMRELRREIRDYVRALDVMRSRRTIPTNTHTAPRGRQRRHRRRVRRASTSSDGPPEPLPLHPRFAARVATTTRARVESASRLESNDLERTS
jgi:hypothetical protein